LRFINAIWNSYSNRNGPEPTNDHRGPDLFGELGSQSFERLHCQALIRDSLLDQRDALVQRKSGCFETFTATATMS